MKHKSKIYVPIILGLILITALILVTWKVNKDIEHNQIDKKTISDPQSLNKILQDSLSKCTDFYTMYGQQSYANCLYGVQSAVIAIQRGDTVTKVNLLCDSTPNLTGSYRSGCASVVAAYFK